MRNIYIQDMRKIYIQEIRALGRIQCMSLIQLHIHYPLISPPQFYWKYNFARSNWIGAHETMEMECVCENIGILSRRWNKGHVHDQLQQNPKQSGCWFVYVFVHWCWKKKWKTCKRHYIGHPWYSASMLEWDIAPHGLNDQETRLSPKER